MDWAGCTLDSTPFAEFSRVEGPQLLSHNGLLIRGNPHVSNEDLFVRPEHIQGVVNGFLFSDIPFEDLKDGNLFLLRLLVLLIKVVLELTH